MYRLITPESPLTSDDVGKIAFTNGIFIAPTFQMIGRITSISKGRVYTKSDEDSEPNYVMGKSIVFVVDTAEEANIVLNKGAENIKRFSHLIGTMKKEWHELLTGDTYDEVD